MTSQTNKSYNKDKKYAKEYKNKGVFPDEDNKTEGLVELLEEDLSKDKIK